MNFRARGRDIRPATGEIPTGRHEVRREDTGWSIRIVDTNPETRYQPLTSDERERLTKQEPTSREKASD